MNDPSSSPHPLRIDLNRRANLDYHHGALPLAKGVQSFQVLRANREQPTEAEGTGWTYNHAPMLAYWNGRLHLEYLSNPVKEHVAPGHSLLTSSVDGCVWTDPEVVFPVYAIAWEGNARWEKEKTNLPTHAIMHQRKGFHVAPNGMLLVLGFYGFSPREQDLPFEERGIGRVVREIHQDGSLGPIYFIRIMEHAGWSVESVNYPLYTASPDEGFRDACESLLADPLIVQQWKEEHGDTDPLIRLKGRYKALSWYTLRNGDVVGLWKWCIAGLSRDRGRSWDILEEVPSIENAGGKIWGQRTDDGRYAIVYNPSTNNKHRWPLAVATSDDGLEFGGLSLVQGRVPPRRYWGGRYKDYGSNYVRGIAEGNGFPPDGALWVAYSMNKEDIWVSRIPVPVANGEKTPLKEDFQVFPAGKIIEGWNTYSPRWAPVFVGESPDDGSHCLFIEDEEPCDCAVAERLFPPAESLLIHLSLKIDAGGSKPLYVELWDGESQIPVRVVFGPEGTLDAAHGRKVDRLCAYETGKWMELEVRVLARRHRFEVSLDGKILGRDQLYQGEPARDAGWYFRASAGALERLVLRTGPLEREPHLDMTVEEGGDRPDSAHPVAVSRIRVRRVIVNATVN